jgi:hypothetical protein
VVTVANVEDAMLQGIMKDVTSTNVALYKEATKLVMNARNFLVQFS